MASSSAMDVGSSGGTLIPRAAQCEIDSCPGLDRNFVLGLILLLVSNLEFHHI